MRVMHDLAVPGRRASDLVVMLPGALQAPEEFIRAGFIDVLRRHQPSFDIALVDPALQFIGDALDERTLQILQETVVEPARRHYGQIWMAGISLGGFLALAHAACYPGQLNGLCLLAPYPGTRIPTRVRTQEAEQISLCQSVPAERHDLESRVRQWLQAKDRSATAIWLGYGKQDRFADGLQRVAASLPPQATDVIEGGHDWETWTLLWSRFMQRGLLQATGG